MLFIAVHKTGRTVGVEVFVFYEAFVHRCASLGESQCGKVPVVFMGDWRGVFIDGGVTVGIVWS